MNKKVRIALDAGHGLYTEGKRCSKQIDPNETREWKLNSRIASKVQKLLTDYDCEVIRVDDISGSNDVALKYRCQDANKWNADIYISIHHNAGAKNTTAGGTVVYHYSQHPEIAELLYNEVINQTGLIGNRSSHVKMNDFYVLVNTRMEAVLIENGFMDSTTDTPIILTEEHADRTAQGIVNFILKQFNLSIKDENYIVNVPFDSYEDAETFKDYVEMMGYKGAFIDKN